jgi:hypothetical protein
MEKVRHKPQVVPQRQDHKVSRLQVLHYKVAHKHTKVVQVAADIMAVVQVRVMLITTVAVVADPPTRLS